ncbi:MAG: FHA domain-containing protein, partial [Myxococcota bacterium]
VHVSPTHASFDFDGTKLFVTDQRSLNGVYRRVQSDITLQDGDFLRLGRQVLRYEGLVSAPTLVPTQAGDETQVWGSPVEGAFGRLLQVMQDGRAGDVRLLCGDGAVLGREQGDIVFPTDGFVSGRHCEIVREGPAVRLRDLGSSNGTYIRLRAKTEIAHGDFLLIGNQMLRVEVI